MPVATVEKKVKCRSNRIKPELRAQFGITPAQLTEAGAVGVVVATLQIPDYKSFDEMLAGETEKANGDSAAAKAAIFKWADTQMATDLANTTRKQFEAPPVSKSVSPQECIIWAKEHEMSVLQAVIADETPGALEAYLAKVKATILAEREAAVASGAAVPAEEEDAAA